jgi:hypothetical protein
MKYAKQRLHLALPVMMNGKWRGGEEFLSGGQRRENPRIQVTVEPLMGKVEDD